MQHPKDWLNYVSSWVCVGLMLSPKFLARDKIWAWEQKAWKDLNFELVIFPNGVVYLD
jgi:hypothetical protein